MNLLLEVFSGFNNYTFWKDFFDEGFTRTFINPRKMPNLSKIHKKYQHWQNLLKIPKKSSKKF